MGSALNMRSSFKLTSQVVLGVRVYFLSSRQSTLNCLEVGQVLNGIEPLDPLLGDGVEVAKLPTVGQLHEWICSAYLIVFRRRHGVCGLPGAIK